MQCSAHNGFVNIDIPISDLQVKTTIRISANPCLVMDIRPLTTEIG